MADWSEVPKWLMPRPNNEDREFWEGAGRGELRIQHCTTWGRYQHYARRPCSPCGKQALAGGPGGGTGQFRGPGPGTAANCYGCHRRRGCTSDASARRTTCSGSGRSAPCSTKPSPIPA